ncbi:MAG: hypothetical protein R6U85_01115, partial [Salinivirgaceae bacterium]
RFPTDIGRTKNIRAIKIEQKPSKKRQYEKQNETETPRRGSIMVDTETGSKHKPRRGKNYG